MRVAFAKQGFQPVAQAPEKGSRLFKTSEGVRGAGGHVQGRNAYGRILLVNKIRQQGQRFLRLAGFEEPPPFFQCVLFRHGCPRSFHQAVSRV